MPLDETAPRSWEEIVGSSKDLAFIPEALIGQVKEWDAKRTEFTKEINRISRLEVEYKVMFENLILALRNYFAGTREDIWSADVGINAEALRDGKFVATISRGQK